MRLRRIGITRILREPVPAKAVQGRSHVSADVLDEHDDQRTENEKPTDVRFLRTFAEWRGGPAVDIHRLCRGCAEAWDDTPGAAGDAHAALIGV